MARWVVDMPDCGHGVRALNMRVQMANKVRAVFRYAGGKDGLIAKKILFNRVFWRKHTCVLLSGEAVIEIRNSRNEHMSAIRAN